MQYVTGDNTPGLEDIIIDYIVIPLDDCPTLSTATSGINFV